MNFDIPSDTRNNIILSIDNSRENTKNYQHTLSGSVFSYPDFQLPVLHKRKIKILNWKELGDKMQVFVKIPKRTLAILDSASFTSAFDYFQWFDEISGDQYSFLYKVGKQKIKEITPLLNQHHITINYQEWIAIKIPQSEKTDHLDILSLLFGLFIIYGSFQTKKKAILGAKIFIPLFGQYTQQEWFFISILKNLAKDQYFISHNIQNTNDGKLLQLSITDHELLKIFSQWYQSIEKYEEITKVIEQQKAITLLERYFEEHNISSTNNLQLKLLTKE